jgi:glycosidase
MKKITRFWLEEVGVDGFRVDAAKYLLEDGTIIQNSDATHAWFKEFRQYYKMIKPDSMTVGEVWDITPTAAKYAQGAEMDLVFDFGLAQALILAARTGRAAEVEKAVLAGQKVFKPLQFATFIANHDLNRAMSQLMRDPQKARLAAMLLLTLPGVPFLYYGEEIGMQGIKPDEQIRTPMQWSTEANAGFTIGQPWMAVNEDYQQGISVQEQNLQPSSNLYLYRQLIMLRNAHPALRVGSYIPVQVSNTALLAFVRADQDQSLLVLVNLGKEAVNDYQLNLSTSLSNVPLEANLIWGTGTVESPLLTLQGGFENYQPIGSVPAGDMIVIELIP